MSTKLGAVATTSGVSCGASSERKATGPDLPGNAYFLCGRRAVNMYTLRVKQCAFGGIRRFGLHPEVRGQLRGSFCKGLERRGGGKSATKSAGRGGPTREHGAVSAKVSRVCHLLSAAQFGDPLSRRRTVSRTWRQSPRRLMKPRVALCIERGEDKTKWADLASRSSDLEQNRCSRRLSLWLVFPWRTGPRGL